MVEQNKTGETGKSGGQVTRAGHMARVFIAVGSNMEPERHIPAALDALGDFGSVEATSTFYRSAPVERSEQPMFANGVWQYRTGLAPAALKFRVLRKIESRLERQRTEDPHAPRTIDLDLILYGDQVIDEPDLEIPDPEITSRPFVAIPLLELDPELVIPRWGVKLRELDVAEKSDGLEVLEALTEQLRKQIRK